MACQRQGNLHTTQLHSTIWSSLSPRMAPPADLWLFLLMQSARSLASGSRAPQLLQEGREQQGKNLMGSVAVSSKLGLLKSGQLAHNPAAQQSLVKPEPSNSAGESHWMERAASSAVGCKSWSSTEASCLNKSNHN